MEKTALIILDGWGIGQPDDNNAVHTADTPCFEGIMERYPHARLTTHGEQVGLPEGQMGNSEVGHLNIGAGRIVYQDLLRIDRAVADGQLATEPTLQAALSRAKQDGCRLHFMGLVSQGGVHSQQAHLHALLRIAADAGVPDVVVHAFTDGRDTAPKLGAGYLTELQEVCDETGAAIATVCGRYWAMDRDRRWERIAKAYRAMVHGEGMAFDSAAAAMKAAYDSDTTDEFVEPAVLDGVDGLIRNGDVVLCFNFRTDRCRQITTALTQEAFADHGMVPLDLHYVTMTNYDDRFQGVHVMYDKPNLKMTLGEAVSAASGTQLRLAETEKYPHVTFFFSGGREEEFPGEQRAVAPSPKVATYDLQPTMSASGVADAAIAAMTSGAAPDFICLNFANPDMVGHTGVFEAVVTACEETDRQLARVLEAGQNEGYHFVVIADHGNAEYARNPDGSPHTAHTTNLVPVVIIEGQGRLALAGSDAVRDGILADVAPTVLDLMGIAVPEEMTGRSLLGKAKP
ncbi:MAG: 2,3-bisphosphoglycerate-independent phosphoglycerate mutase [Flavobacteriales bacterium]|nr:2,3-bisphosphoglycerate-independent phosphoglycerate mutase [Flavobacteriales bacterium]